MNQYVCVHGHFYQPPRENAWLEAIETQPSAYPYHDWNERITAQCYLPNSIARINDEKGLVVKIVNNYSRMSFDFGPTLLSWLETSEPDVYNSILAADKESRQRFSGHGSALAHAYNHIIMPLANRRDKYTEVYWGIRDFEHRFKRQPEGMWLPETAVDLETLDIMASLNIKFTILAPRQALYIRKIGEKDWQEVNENTLDTTVPYRMPLNSGRVINLFFYNGAIAADVAFHGLLENGENLVNRLLRSFKPARNSPQLAHIATDGESYGHHHRFGEMALAYALHHIETNNLAQITNYGEFLSLQPPAYEVQIQENSSWSCVHGVERWRSDCGCSNHYHPGGWNQKWRTPLRKALDWLRDQVNSECEKEANSLFKNPWEARNAYISVILNRSKSNVRQFVEQQASHKLNRKETSNALKYLEIQRHSLLMFTSCGWFFDDLARIETVQVIQYAARVVQLAQEICNLPIETKFLEQLASARSNIKEYGNGIQIYRRFVKPSIVDFKRVAAHFALRSFFDRYPDDVDLYSYEVRTLDFINNTCRRNKINIGCLKVISSITSESTDVSFIALLRDNYDAVAGVSTSITPDIYEKLKNEVAAACSREDLTQIDTVIKARFPDSLYSIESLFRDAQHIILENVMDTSLMDIKGLFYPALEAYSLVTPLADETVCPLPETFHELIQLILNLELRLEFRKKDGPEVNFVQKRLDDAKLWGVQLDSQRLGVVISQAVEKVAKAFTNQPQDEAFLDSLIMILNLVNSLPFHPDLQRIQGIYYQTMNTIYKDIKAGEVRGDLFGPKWVDKFIRLGNLLYIKVS